MAPRLPVELVSYIFADALGEDIYERLVVKRYGFRDHEDEDWDMVFVCSQASRNMRAIISKFASLAFGAPLSSSVSFTLHVDRVFRSMIAFQTAIAENPNIVTTTPPPPVDGLLMQAYVRYFTAISQRDAILAHVAEDDDRECVDILVQWEAGWGLYDAMRMCRPINRTPLNLSKPLQQDVVKQVQMNQLVHILLDVHFNIFQLVLEWHRDGNRRKGVRGSPCSDNEDNPPFLERLKFQLERIPTCEDDAETALRARGIPEYPRERVTHEILKRSSVSSIVPEMNDFVQMTKITTTTTGVADVLDQITKFYAEIEDRPFPLVETAAARTTGYYGY